MYTTGMYTTIACDYNSVSYIFYLTIGKLFGKFYSYFKFNTKAVPKQMYKVLLSPVIVLLLPCMHLGLDFHRNVTTCGREVRWLKYDYAYTTQN